MNVTEPENSSDDASRSRSVGLASHAASSGGIPPVDPVGFGTGDDPDGRSHLGPPSEKKGTVDGAEGQTIIQPPPPEPDEPKIVKLSPNPVVIRNAPGQLIDFSSNGGIPKLMPNVAPDVDGSALTYISTESNSRLDPNSPDTEIGPYEILGELGRGGMGVVYKARHQQLHREVALKMILKADVGDHLLSRFHLEAQSVATLKHPGIVQIFEYGEHRGVPWFALEYVDGKTLAQLSANEPLAPNRAARIVADLAAAVAYAHQKGVLHRDIKPANVLVAAGDIPKLTDFGLAKRATDDFTDESLDHKTIDGQIMGTPSYMPPEQARGVQTMIGPHSDQYSLGATLYHLLTGRAPFVGSRPIEVVMQVIERRPLTVRQLQPNTPLDLETICLKAMAKEPDRRYPDCAAFEADLRRFLRHEPILARPIGGLERSIRWCRRNPKIAIPIATAVVSIVTALSVSIWSAVTLAQKNEDIEKQKDVAVAAKKLADTNAETAEKNAREADDNAKRAYGFAVASKDSVYEMLKAIRNDIPSTEEKLLPVRKQLLRIASTQLERLPDVARDDKLTTGLRKAQILEDQYLTALELGQPSKAIKYLESAELILRERNTEQATDQTRLNLSTVLYRQAQARLSAQRDMEKVTGLGEESLTLLNDILANPNPINFDADHGSVPRIDTLTQVMIHGYQHALTYKRVGRVRDGFEVLERALSRFDEAMEILRGRPPFKSMADDQWVQQKQTFRGMISDQLQLRTILLASVGRDQDAADEQQHILENVRRLVTTDNSIENYAKLALTLVYAGDLARQRGNLDGGLSSYEESAGITRKIYQDNPALEDRRNRHHVSLMRLGGLLRSRDLPKARQLYAEAKSIGEDMVKSDNESITAHIALALVSPFSGPPEKAAEMAEAIWNRSRPGDAEIDIDLARVWSAAAESEGLAETPDAAAIDRWNQRALELISRAVETGYRDGVYLSGEPDFSAIRSLPEFTSLLERCSNKTDHGSQSHAP